MSTGNTWGKVSGDTPKSTVKAAAANPAVDEANILEDAQAATKSAIDDWVESTGYNQGAMVAGAVATAVAEVFMPTAWWELVPVGKAGKILKKGGETVGVLKKGEKTAEAAKDAKKAEDAAKAEKKTESGGGGKDTQVKKRPKQKVKCFCPQDRAKGGRDEYDRQLKHQQDGINAMSVDEYLAQRGGFSGQNPCTGESVPQAPGRDRKVTKKAKNKRQKEQTQRYAEQFGKQGLGRSDAKRMGGAKARRELGQQDALHNQDMVAGGKDAIGSNGKLGDADFGFSDTNQHIGSQWRGDRINSMDAEACRRKQAGEGNEKMNVELRACGKHEVKKAGCKSNPRK